MPKAASRTTGPKATNNRSEPYTKSPPKRDNSSPNQDKENINPSTNTPKKPTSTKQPDPESESNGDYRNIPLDEYKGEVPCYDNATTVRRKLKKLLSDKSQIPGTNKKWSQAAMAAEMQELEKRDTRCRYYWGYILLEKLRIHNGEKKSKGREKAEEEFPGGHVREDHTKRRITMHRDSPDPPGAWDPESRAERLAQDAPPMMPSALGPPAPQPPLMSIPGGPFVAQPPPQQ